MFQEVLSKLSLFQIDFLVAIIGFTLIRYYLPNYILSKNSNLKTGVVLAFCYALFGSVRSYVIEMKEDNEKRQGTVGYYYNV